MTRILMALALVLAVAGCSSDGGDETKSEDLRESGTQTCSLNGGFEFETRFSNCSRATERGMELVRGVGGEEGASDSAAEISLSVSCSTLQEDSEMTTTLQASMDLNHALNIEGVCPGDESKLTYKGP